MILHGGKDDFSLIMETNQLRTHFQPIIELGEGHLFGFESLSRGPVKTMFETPDALFREARRRDLLFLLEKKCQLTLLATLRKCSDPGFYMFFNLEPILLERDDFRHLPIFQSLKEIDPRNFVIELTERYTIHEGDSLKRNLNSLRDLGFRIAIDDIGSGYSDLDSIVEFRPEFLKISNRIVRDIAVNSLKQKVVTLLLELSKGLAYTIAEGIETVEDFQMLRSLGVPLGQGYLLAEPRAEMNYVRELHLYSAIRSQCSTSSSEFSQYSSSDIG
jgi:FOG: EAL domain